MARKHRPREAPSAIEGQNTRRNDPREGPSAEDDDALDANELPATSVRALLSTIHAGGSPTPAQTLPKTPSAAHASSTLTHLTQSAGAGSVTVRVVTSRVMSRLVLVFYAVCVRRLMIARANRRRDEPEGDETRWRDRSPEREPIRDAVRDRRVGQRHALEPYRRGGERG